MSSDVATQGTPDVPDSEAVRALLQKEASSAGAGAFARIVSSPDVEIERSATVVRKDEKHTLVDIPIAVTTIRFSKSDKGRFAEGIDRDKVTLEIVTFDDRKIVINDGSTGIRRQIVQKLQDKGFIDVGQAHMSQPDGNPFDKPMNLWLMGEDAAKAGFDLTGMEWVYPRGLRSSEYDHPEFGEAETFYLA